MPVDETVTKNKKYFRIFFLTGSLIILFLSLLFLAIEIQLKRTSLKSLEINETLLASDRIRTDIHHAISDLKIMANSSILHNERSNWSRAELENIQEYFMLYMVNVPDTYDQIRLLALNGKELVRINRGTPYTITPQDQLQDKSSRYYFKKSVILPYGEIYRSPLDLNVENGKIEEPHKPMIRLATPVFSRNGQKKGVLILNFLAKSMLDGIHTVHRHHNFTDRGYSHSIFFLNQDGYYFNNPDQDKNWGFMFPDKQNVGFFNDFPEAWNTIQKQRSGYLESTVGFFAFSRVESLSADSIGDTSFWYAISYTPVSSIISVTFDLAMPVALIAGILILILWLIGGILLRNRITLELMSVNSYLEKRIVEEIDKRRKQEVILFQKFRLQTMTEMLHSIMHYWRQPMATMGLIMENVKDAYDSGDLNSEFFERSHDIFLHEMKRLSGYLNDYENVVRPDQRKEMFSAREAIEELIHLNTEKLKGRGIELVSTFQTETEGFSDQIYSFRSEFQQIFQALIQNCEDAYEESGKNYGNIIIHYHQDSSGKILIRLEDNHGGVSHEAFSRIFDPYFSTHKNRVGLGLYLARIYFEQSLGAEITAENLNDGFAILIRIDPGARLAPDQNRN